MFYTGIFGDKAAGNVVGFVKMLTKKLELFSSTVSVMGDEWPKRHMAEETLNFIWGAQHHSLSSTIVPSSRLHKLL